MPLLKYLNLKTVALEILSSIPIVYHIKAQKFYVRKPFSKQKLYIGKVIFPHQTNSKISSHLHEDRLRDFLGMFWLMI